MEISIVILTYNRPEILEENLTGLLNSSNEIKEIIVIDNSPDDTTKDMVCLRFPQVKYLHNKVNIGAAGRNIGLREATGDIVMTLDDDILGIGSEDLRAIRQQFQETDNLGGVCFRVLHFQTGKICNWCHHRKQENDGLGEFPTYEISEGAAAYRRNALEKSGLYFEKFFLSHEGKDLAFRLMNQEYQVVYNGRICVTHRHSCLGRTEWRRYYYDTRNSIWLAVRNMPYWYGFKFLTISLLSMIVYSIRDGFLKYWVKAVWDGLKGVPEILKSRTPWSEETTNRVREIDRLRPGFFYMVKLRLFQRNIEI